MDHTEELDHTVELHHAACFYCGSCHELDIDGASSRPQLAGREVAFYTNRHFNFEHTVSQSSCHREGLQITRGSSTPMVVLCKLVSFIEHCADWTTPILLSIVFTSVILLKWIIQ